MESDNFFSMLNVINMLDMMNLYEMVGWINSCEIDCSEKDLVQTFFSRIPENFQKETKSS